MRTRCRQAAPALATLLQNHEKKLIDNVRERLSPFPLGIPPTSKGATFEGAHHEKATAAWLLYFIHKHLAMKCTLSVLKAGIHSAPT